MTVSAANYVFLPWVRQGAAAGIQTPDGLNDAQAGVVLVPVKLRVNDTPDIERKVRLHGPGDVTGIDPQQVVRTEPRHLAKDFEPNYFPAIEFDRPDFPWLFTPAKAAAGKLRPWLCLVVVRKQEGVTLRHSRNLPLPILEIKSPAVPRLELPDLTESWAWAHTQITGSRPEEAALRQSLAGNPALTVSRLLCPRRLDPLTDYLACVVPTFELGCKAGLGLPVTANDEKFLKAAWASGPQSPAQVALPVYFQWEFRTGAGGDFEALVGLLEARDSDDLSAEVGKRQMAIGQAAFPVGHPLQVDTTLEFEGALRLLNAASAEWPAKMRKPFQEELKRILEIPWQAINQSSIEPLVAPPIYGCWHAARHSLEANSTLPSIQTWLDELNLDPRYRAVAALGTAIVQSQQEQLMGSAWEQLGEIERINQMRRQAQLGRAVNAAYHAKHFTRFSEESLLKVVAPAQSRIVVEMPAGSGVSGDSNLKARALLSKFISQSALPDRTVSAPLRRLTSPRSTISARFQSAGASPIALVAWLNTSASIVADQRIETGQVTLNQVTQAQTGTHATELKQTVFFDRVFNALTAAPRLRDFTIMDEGVSPKRNLLSFTYPAATADNAASPAFLAFREAAKAHQSYLMQSSLSPASVAPELPPLPMNLSATQSALLESVSPEKTVTGRVEASLKIAGDAGMINDPLEPIMDAPDFPHPMYEALRDLSQDFLFPGLEHVPPNTITLLETNSKFVESFMVGLNTEMGREFLWRNYPTDQRGTYFRQFWDTSAGNEQPDIEPIHEWDKTSRLGDNAQAGDNLVLLIRGELLRRYPNSVIYAVAAERRNGHLDLSLRPEDERHPLFRGTLKPDVTFLGFGLTREDAKADPGWFFVIQQQPTEPCFGMDVADFDKPAPPLTTWNNLSWRHMAASAEELKTLSHASIQKMLPDIDKAKWGRNSAHQAYITLQRPMRIAIHAKEMLP